MKLESYKDLTVWRRSIQLVKAVYELTSYLPKQELYGLVSQIRRSAVSIPSNIAEGYKRRGRAEYLQFLSIAEGSAAELDTQITITKMLYTNIYTENAEQLLGEVQKMLYAMRRTLRPTP